MNQTQSSNLKGSSHLDFIKKLQKERTEYSHASQVRMQAKSLLQLSQGIYTEPERFVYELLQNAVDAFVDTGEESLEIMVEVRRDCFVFMHNGKPFDENDVVGISDVGNGTKTNDTKKIGYKGIGFKSVFMPSVSRVSVISGEFCFEFNKEKAFSLMPEFPSEELPLTQDDIPWQVIPIDISETINEFEHQTYNVITVVYTSDAIMIGEKIEKMFNDLQFLLFLRCSNVNIRLIREGKQDFYVGKSQNQNEKDNIPVVSLTRNGAKESSWLIFEENIPVPNTVKIALERDFNTPDKLKGAQDVSISFAVQIEDNLVVPVKDSTIFTFLPTSYRGLKQPFLINSNFITDAGRQQLHQESVWNKLIFSKIPELYLRFVASFSFNFSNYTQVLPTIYPDNDSLVSEYRESLAKAFDTLAFIPNRNGNRLLKLSEVLIDNTEVSKKVVSEDAFLSHINKVWGENFTSDNFVDDKNIASYSHDKVNIFEASDLEKLLLDDSIVSGLDLDGDIKLIHFLSYYTKELSSQSRTAYESLMELLRNLSFLKNQDGVYKRPQDLFFPAVFDNHEWNDDITEISILNNVINEEVKNSKEEIGWLRSLGVRDLSKIAFVEYLFNHSDYITQENASSVGLFLFNTWKKENYLDDEVRAKKMKELNFLAKDGTLHPISNLYLGSVYGPDDDMESVYPQKSMYISDDYPTNNNFDDWAYFLKKCGIGYKVSVTERIYGNGELNFDFLKNAAVSFSNAPAPINPRSGYCGFPNPIVNIKFKLNYFGFVEYNNPNIEIDRFVFSKILSVDRKKINTDDRIFGNIHYWGNLIEKPLGYFTPFSYTSQYQSFLEYIIANEQKFPTTLGTSEKADKIYINQSTIKDIGGKYLPILDIDCPVHESWRNVIPFRKDLLLSDLLFVLEQVSKDENADRESRRECVSRVYREIIDRDLQQSDELSKWAESNTLLAKSDAFLPVSELSYITVDGFNGNDNKVYCEKVIQGNKEKLLQLLRTFGVRVITQQDIKPIFDNQVENDEIKELLLKKVHYIAILKGITQGDIETTKSILIDKINQSRFYKCNSISLTYGEDCDTISRTAFFRDDCIYYTGGISLVGIEPLLSPLCSFLGLNMTCESELMVILLMQSPDDICSFLKGKGYDLRGLILPVENENGTVIPGISGHGEGTGLNASSSNGETQEILPSSDASIIKKNTEKLLQFEARLRIYLKSRNESNTNRQFVVSSEVPSTWINITPKASISFRVIEYSNIWKNKDSK